MRPRFNSSQRWALLALEGGTLRHGEHGWLAEGEAGAQQLSDGVVRWLLGEGFVARSDAGRFRLNERGEAALREVRDEEELLAAPGRTLQVGVPVVLLNPAPYSEELDYLLVVPLGPVELELHRERMRHLASVRTAERFEFIQFRDELFALPITPRLAELELLPQEETLVLEQGLDNADELGIRHCPDRGVNYGSGWLQWFGGFDPESPLIVSSRIGVDEFGRLAGVSTI